MEDKMKEIMSIILESEPNLLRLQQLIDSTTDQEFENISGKSLYTIAATLNFYKDYKRAYHIFNICQKNKPEWAECAKKAMISLVLNHGKDL